MQTRIFSIQQSYWLQGGYADMCYEILQQNLEVHFVVSTCEGGNAKYRKSGVEGYLHGPVRTRTHLLDLHVPYFSFLILNLQEIDLLQVCLKLLTLTSTSATEPAVLSQSHQVDSPLNRVATCSDVCKLCRSKDNLWAALFWRFTYESCVTVYQQKYFTVLLILFFTTGTTLAYLQMGALHSLCTLNYYSGQMACSVWFKIRSILLRNIDLIRSYYKRCTLFMLFSGYICNSSLSLDISVAPLVFSRYRQSECQNVAGDYIYKSVCFLLNFRKTEVSRTGYISCCRFINKTPNTCFTNYNLRINWTASSLHLRQTDSACQCYSQDHYSTRDHVSSTIIIMSLISDIFMLPLWPMSDKEMKMIDDLKLLHRNIKQSGLFCGLTA